MAKTLKDRAFDLAPECVKRFLFRRRQARRLTDIEFQALRRQFGDDARARARYCHDQFVCRVIIDPNLILVIKKLQADFRLLNFVETGTYDGETSLAMSLLFERIFTCDVRDWKRRLEFYHARNLIYETKSSPEFLRAHLPEIRTHSLFYLDAHWGAYWPLRDELDIVFGQCENPVILIDDFDAGNGLYFDQYKEQKLDFSYIADHVPGDYKFCVNPWSNRNRGMIFIFPPSAPYGCRFGERARYDEANHGLWGKLTPSKA
ncbi:MAG TPA: hypothetical protein P5205_17050 [Candidatus Paceibacterota bacterium]|nr:hypothetical protein [Verrucomicrobiota bacterium]HSA12072.1 hypothetical protein [Candidatus Paceibacterota bacterium]